MKFFSQVLFIAFLIVSTMSATTAQSCGSTNELKKAKKLMPNSKQSGEVKAKSKLHFISPIASNKNKAKLEINEVSGNLKTIVTVCKVDENGVSSKVVTKTFNDTASKKKKNNESFTYSFEDLQGYKVALQFDGKSVGNTVQFDGKSVGNTFAFNVKLK